MKKLIFVLGLALVMFSCSKDNINTETTADLTQTTEAISTIEFSGVFGHHLIQDLHGKIYVTINGNKSEASIHLVNGDEMKFQGSQVSQDASTIYFTSDHGSFVFNALEENGARVSDLVIGDVNDAYVVTIEVATRGGGMILLGTYEQDGVPGWNGNWDMLGDGIDITKFGANANLVAIVVVTHTTGFVAIDSSMEPQVGACTGGDPDTFMWDPLGDVATGGNPSCFAHFQSTMIKGAVANWGIEYRRDVGEQTYVNDDCTAVVPSGLWSWRGKTGTILASEPPPSPLTQENVTRSSLNNSLIIQ